MINSKKIYIKAYTRINLGDDLFIHILCSRYPDHYFYIKSNGKYTDIFKNIPNLVILDDFSYIDFDAYVYIGGSIFIESSETSKLKVLELKDDIISKNIPTYIIGANFGPYTSQEYFDIVKNQLFPHIESITFRDKYSYNLFKELGNVHYSPDVVFSLDTTKITKNEKKEIGISVVYHLERKELKPFYYEYIKKIVEICKYYIGMGFTVRLFSFCEYEKDMVAITDITEKMSNYELKSIRISNYQGDIPQILSEISSLKLFITSRFHANILGIKFNIPIIPICYSSKSSNVLNDINFDRNLIYNFETVNRINYKNIPIPYNSENIITKQFNDLDLFIKNKIKLHV